MSRSRPSGLVAALLVLLAAGCGGDDPRPNVILITLDTTRADHLGYEGYERARTPVLDAMAASSVRFRRCFTTSNNTLPAHASILTGRYPHVIGLPRNSFPLLPGIPTVADRLRDAGYATAAFVSAEALASGLGLARGFDLYDDTFDVQELDQRQRTATGTTDAVLEWLATDPPEPWLVWVHYFDPHYPYTPPDDHVVPRDPDYDGEADGSMEYLTRVWGYGDAEKITTTEGDRNRLIDLYDGEIAFLDTQLGRLLDAFDAVDPHGRDLRILTADHGESLTEHDYLFNHGEYVYQPSMHVPLLVRFPGADPVAGIEAIDPATVWSPVTIMDVASTVYAVTGVAGPSNLDGRDLTPLARGASPEAPRLLFGESCRPWRVEEMFPRAYPNLYKAQMVVRFPWKLIVTPFASTIELYDLDVDPDELHDVAADQPELVEELRGAIAGWRARTAEAVGQLDRENLERLRSLGYVN